MRRYFAATLNIAQDGVEVDFETRKVPIIQKPTPATNQINYLERSEERPSGYWPDRLPLLHRTPDRRLSASEPMAATLPFRQLTAVLSSIWFWRLVAQSTALL
jgi:hypothetical protein